MTKASAPQPAWVAVDWGTSNLRLWLIASNGDVLEQRQSDQGMGSLSPDEFEPVLEGLLRDITGSLLPVICCGMVGSRQGWVEAPYVSVPCKAPTIDAATRFKTDRFDVFILPGVKQDSPADVMRGEETQIAGFLAAEPDFDGVVCLPGTHAKWVHISAGELVSYRTFMTGEIFALLSGQSVLRHSVSGDGWDQAAFDTALSEAISRPSDLAGRLFSLRAQSLLNGMTADTGRAALSGLLIGAELAAAKPYWLGQEVAIIGASSIAKAYETALKSQGVQVRIMAADTLTLAGLTAAYQTLAEAV